VPDCKKQLLEPQCLAADLHCHSCCVVAAAVSALINSTMLCCACFFVGSVACAVSSQNVVSRMSRSTVGNVVS
jgi:hypothetical protein